MGVVVPLFAPRPEQGRLPGVEYEPAGPEPVVLSPKQVEGLLQLFEVVAVFADNPQMFTAATRRDLRKAAHVWSGVLLGEEDEVPG
jgi:hypothetical protein